MGLLTTSCTVHPALKPPLRRISGNRGAFREKLVVHYGSFTVVYHINICGAALIFARRRMNVTAAECLVALQLVKQEAYSWEEILLMAKWLIPSPQSLF